MTNTSFLVDLDIFKISMPFRMQISGASGSGKSTIIGEFLRFRKEMFPEAFARVILCYPFSDVSIYSRKKIDKYRQYYPSIQEHDGLPNVHQMHILGKKDEHVLLIIDDLSAELFKSPDMAHLFSNVSSHERISVMVPHKKISVN